MATFDLNQFIEDVRAAARVTDAADRIEALVRDALGNPDAVRNTMSGFSGEEEILFEDETVSIQYCGFFPNAHVPPHNHQTTAVIGVYDGAELNHLYQPKDGRLLRHTTHEMHPGDVLRLAPDDIHSVETANNGESSGIHVYLAALKSLDRSLYDWETGEAIPYSDEKYQQLKARGGEFRTQ